MPVFFSFGGCCVVRPEVFVSPCIGGLGMPSVSTSDGLGASFCAD